MSGLIFLTGGCEKAQEKPFLEILPENVNLRPEESQNFIAVFSDSGQPVNTVAWAVNGAPGGDDVYGKITPNGGYTAPSIFPSNDRIFIQASADGADNGSATVFLTTFEANQRINDDVLQASSHLDSRSANQNALAVSGDNVYIVWSDNRNGDGDIYFSRSTNGGSLFDLPIRVNSVTSGDQ
ncbi:MAG: hypothetical protein HZA19_07040 [Nitrospirae bacterium]|nr:hypothetical protein [Nitrospirota bacterium]